MPHLTYKQYLSYPERDRALRAIRAAADSGHWQHAVTALMAHDAADRLTPDTAGHRVTFLGSDGDVWTDPVIGWHPEYGPFVSTPEGEADLVGSDLTCRYLVWSPATVRDGEPMTHERAAAILREEASK